MSQNARLERLVAVGGPIPEVPVEGGTGRAVVSPAASTLRDEMAVSGQRLLAASGQIPMAAHSRVSEPCGQGATRTSSGRIDLAFQAGCRLTERIFSLSVSGPSVGPSEGEACKRVTGGAT